MNITELRDKGRYSRPCYSDTVREASGQFWVWLTSLLSLYSHSVHEARRTSKRRYLHITRAVAHLPLYSRRPCPGGSGNNSWHQEPGPLGLNFSDRRSSQVGLLLNRKRTWNS